MKNSRGDKTGNIRRGGANAPAEKSNASEVSTVLTFRFQAIELKSGWIAQIPLLFVTVKRPDRIEVSRPIDLFFLALTRSRHVEDRPC